jgi:prepilin-type N-terminal cleavage/methylation domain-containing protein
MYSFRKSKKGFTLIELMVVVAIIGVLVLLGLRAYSSQKERAANAIAKANASTIQTMLVGYMGDKEINTTIGVITGIEDALGAETKIQIESMINPYDSTKPVYLIDQTAGSAFTEDNDETMKGMVIVNFVDDNDLIINAIGKDGKLIMDPPETRSLPANKY